MCMDSFSDHHITYLSYCNSFFIRDIREEFGLINVHWFDSLPAISSRKVRDFLSGELESGNAGCVYIFL